MAYSVVLHVVMLLSLSFVTTHGVRGEYRTKTAVEICVRIHYFFRLLALFLYSSRKSNCCHALKYLPLEKLYCEFIIISCFSFSSQEQNTAQTEPVDKTPAETTINLSCDCKAKGKDEFHYCHLVRKYP